MSDRPAKRLIAPRNESGTLGTLASSSGGSSYRFLSSGSPGSMRFWIPSSPARSKRGEGDVRISRWIGGAELDALRLRIRGVGRNADRGGTVSRGVSEVDRRFKAGDEALVAVRRWIRDAGQRGRVLKNAADEEERHLAKAGVTITRRRAVCLLSIRTCGCACRSRCRRRAVLA
jgi:hypothetical protein